MIRIEGEITTSFPSFQFAGVATLYSDVNCGLNNRDFIKLRPVEAGWVN
jgi:hypothetical protein